MTATVEAIYEHGVLRPVAPIYLPEGAKVDVIVVSKGPGPSGQEPAQILAAIAALPVEGSSEPFSQRDHDTMLYGERCAP